MRRLRVQVSFTSLPLGFASPTEIFGSRQKLDLLGVPIAACSCGLWEKISGFHPDEQGSSPCRSTNICRVWPWEAIRSVKPAFSTSEVQFFGSTHTCRCGVTESISGFEPEDEGSIPSNDTTPTVGSLRGGSRRPLIRPSPDLADLIRSSSTGRTAPC